MTRKELEEKISNLEQMLAKAKRHDAVPTPRRPEPKAEAKRFEYDEDLFDNMPV